MAKIVVNGVEYASIEDVPREVRAMYEKSQVVLEYQSAGTAGDTVDRARTNVSPPVIQTRTVYKINGHEYTSIDDMPPEERAICEKVMAAMASQNGGTAHRDAATAQSSTSILLQGLERAQSNTAGRRPNITAILLAIIVVLLATIAMLLARGVR